MVIGASTGIRPSPHGDKVSPGAREIRWAGASIQRRASIASRVPSTCGRPRRETSHPRPIARSCLGAATSLRSFLSHLRPATSSPKNTSVASASCSERRKFPASRRIATPEGAPLQDVGRRLERRPFSGARFVVSGVDAAAAISCPRPMFATGSGASGRLGTWGPDPVDLKAMAQATQLDMAIAYRNVVRILGGLGGARCGGGGRSSGSQKPRAARSRPHIRTSP
jgi:hypothetical protein